jgi:thioredoxin 1
MNVAFITELNDNNFQNILEQNQMVLVDVWAEWCGPCKMVAPIVDEISVDFQGRVLVGKLDADANKETLSQLGVRNIPTLLLYKNGEVVDKLVGAVSKQKLTDMINTHI